jgi:prepilin-type N-terminal cleavage/methylation domain-containing protein
MMSMRKGFTLAEVVVATSLVTVFIAALIGAHNLYIRSARLDPERVRAVFLAQEAVENLKFARSESWSALIATLPGTQDETIDGKFTRTTTLSDVDAHSKLATVTVTWDASGSTATVSLSTYIANLYDN